MKGYIHSTESLGAVDGPGVRFVVFFQGCPLRCAYCHNPDTWELNVGNQMEADEILEKMLRNISFYRTGGITATGGEPMMQMDFLTELFAKAKEKGVHTCLDTSGIAFNPNNTEKVDKLLEVTDLVMLDIKHIDEDKHIELTKQSGKNILEFAKYLNEKGKKMWIRHVIVPGITLDDDELSRLGQFLKNFDNVEKIETLPYHSLARHKYENMGMDYPMEGTPDATKEQAEYAKNIIMENMK
ncbi:MAG: pyruvate formate lyase-activating protein [Clostridia bacterium]|nr:pyruvate formate lyase-activating protein [Clostridia bacterium]